MALLPDHVVLQLAKDLQVQAQPEAVTLTTGNGVTVRMTPEEYFGFVSYLATPQAVGALARGRQVDAKRRLQRWVNMGLLQEVPVTQEQRTPFTVRLNPQCAQLFIVFNGLLVLPQSDPWELLRASGLLDRNLLWLRDLQGHAYARGIGDDVPTFDALLAWLRGFRAALPHVEEVYTCGFSSGAYAAALVGSLLDVDRAFAFAIPEGDYDAYGPGRDLRTVLHRPHQRTEVHFYYNRTSPSNDAEVAESFAGCPRAFLHPQDGDGHAVWQTMFEKGALGGLFPEFRPSSELDGARLATADPGPAPALEDALLDLLRPLVRTDVAPTLERTTPLLGVVDSLAIITLIQRIEERFGVVIDLGSLEPSDFSSVETIAALVRPPNTPQPY